MLRCLHCSGLTEAYIAENVLGLISKRHKDAFEAAVLLLREAGYAWPSTVSVKHLCMFEPP